MPLEQIGFQAVIKDLQKYLAAVNQMAASNVKLAQSELRYITAAEAADKRFQNIRARQIASQASVVNAVKLGNDRINEFNLRSASIAERLAQRRADLEEKLVRSNRTVSQEIRKNGEASVRALEARADAQKRLDNFNINSASRLAAVERARGRLSQQVSAQIIAAKNAEVVAGQNAARVATTNALAETRANLALAASRGTVVRSLGFGNQVLGLFRTTANLAAAATNAFGRALIAVTGFSNRFAVSIRFGALAIAAFTSAFVVSEASQFEQVLAKIDVLTNATAEEVNFLAEEFKELATTIPKTPDELGTAAYFVLSSGINDVNEALSITELSAKAATIGLGTTEEVARILTSILNAYGKENISAAQATDILVAAIREGSAEAPDFVQNLGRLLGLGPTLGVEFDQLVAAIADLTNVGLPAHQAATALLGIFNQLQSPSAEAAAAIKQAGSSIEELRATVREKGLIPALVDLLGLFGNNVQVLEQLFPEVRGLTGALLLLRDESSRYDDILTNIRNSAGITEESFQRMSETFAFQAGLLRNQLNILLINLGEKILPSLTAKLQDIIGFVQRNEDAIIAWTEAIVNFTARLIGDFVRGLNIVIDLLRTLVGEKFLVIGAFVAIGAAIVIALGSASPAVAAIIALIVLIGVLKRVTTDISERINNLLGLQGSKLPAVEKAISDLERRQLESPGTNFSSPEFLREKLEAAGVPEFALDEAVLATAEKLAEIRREQAAAERIATEAAEAYNNTLKEIAPQYEDTSLAALGSLSELKDGVISFEEATELGIDALRAGALEAAFATDKVTTAAFEYEKALSRVANAFAINIDVARQFALDISRSALEATQEAASAIFSRPTREILDLELALNSLQIANAATIRGLERQSDALENQTDALEDQSDALDDSSKAIDENIRRLQEQLGAIGAVDPIEAIENRRRELLAEQNAPDISQERFDAIANEIKQLAIEREQEIQKQEIQRQIDLANAQKDRIEKEKETIQDEIEAINEKIASIQKEAQAVKESEAEIQRQIDLYNLQNTAAQKQIEAADQTLLTQEELNTKAAEVAREMLEQSGAVRTLSDLLNRDLIPEMDDMREAAGLADDALRILADTDFREIFSAYENQLDAIAEQQEVALQAMFTPLNTEVETLTINIQELNKAFSEGLIGKESLSPTGEPILGQQHGGLITKPTTTLRGEHHLPELVLPLSEPMRSRELMMSLPPGLIRQITPSQAPQIGSLIGGVSVQGIITPEIEHMVNLEVRRQLNRARAGIRSIGL